MPPQGDLKRIIPGTTRARQGGLRLANESVIFSCFAPPAVGPGTFFALKVSAYLKRVRDTALREALSEGATEAGRPEGMSIAKGGRVTVHLVSGVAGSGA